MIVKYTRPEFEGQTLVFDTDDVLGFETRCGVKTLSKEGETAVRELTDERTLSLRFAEPNSYHWEKD